MANIILNPGFLEPEDPNDQSPPYTRTIIFGEDVLSTSESGSEEEEPMSFKRKFSLFSPVTRSNGFEQTTFY